MHIKRKIVKELRPKKSPNTMRKAIDYGYDDDYSNKLSSAKEVKKSGKKPVAKDTNKTRRRMINPTKKGSY